MASLYADEDFPHPVVERLQVLGQDVLTAQDAGRANQKIPDAQVIAYAAKLGRAVLTHNRRDYVRLHKSSSQHAGIIICTHNPDRDALAQRIHEALEKTTDMHGQLIRITRK